jgi:hypothetical protein
MCQPANWHIESRQESESRLDYTCNEKPSRYTHHI